MEQLWKATHHSMKGLQFVFQHEAAFRKEALVFILSIPIAFFLAPDWLWFAAMVGVFLVMMAIELLNTGLEKLADHVTPEQHPPIGIVKDCGSAAVFCGLCLGGVIWICGVLTRFF